MNFASERKAITTIFLLSWIILTGSLIFIIANSQHMNFILAGVIAISDSLLGLSLIILNKNFKKQDQAEIKLATLNTQLITANIRLKESDERFSLALNGSRTGLWDWEVGSENMFYSTFLKNMLGYAESELPNTLEEFYKHIHPDDLPHVKKMIHAHLTENKPYDLEHRIHLKQGDYHWFHVAGQALRDQKGKAVRMVGSIVDITENKNWQMRLVLQYQVARILADSNEMDDVLNDLLTTICENLNWRFAAIWTLDMHTQLLHCIKTYSQKNGNFTHFEKSTQSAVFGLGNSIPGTVLETEAPLWIADLKEQAHSERRLESLQAGLVSVCCFPIILKKNVIGVIEFYGAEKRECDAEILKMMAAIGTQLGSFIQRKNAETKLRESEAYKTAILGSASDSIITTNEQGKIVSFNPQTTSMYGYNPIELMDAKIEKLIPSIFSLPNLYSQVTEVTGISKSGDHFQQEITLSKMNINNKNMLVIVGRDITERKKVEIMKNEFVSVVSHELRTPLTSIRGSLGLLIGGTVGTFPVKALMLLEIANKNCERLLLLINDILDMEKIESGKMHFHPQKTNIVKLVSESVETNRMYGEKDNVSLQFSNLTQHDTLFALVDPDRLLQVLANLISNAVKFSPANSLVTLTLAAHNGHIRVSVNDQGPGIPLEFQSKIFQKFSQADSSTTRSKGGSGLGLSISKAIIEKLNGELNFTSVPNQGATFYFELPLIQDDDQDYNSISQVQNQHLKLLICEDDLDQANYLKLLLDTAGIQADIAINVEEAKKLLSSNFYHGMLLDLILPDEDGITFIKELRKDPLTKDFPIIVLSIIAQTGRNLINGDAISVIDWLDKPIDFNKVKEAIARIKIKSHADLPRVLLIANNSDNQKKINELLMNKVDVTVTTTLLDARKKIRNEVFDLVILDLILPDGNSGELLPLIAKFNIPIMVYSDDAFNQQYARYVNTILVKSETTNDQLLNTIKHLLLEKV